MIFFYLELDSIGAVVNGCPVDTQSRDRVLPQQNRSPSSPPNKNNPLLWVVFIFSYIRGSIWSFPKNTKRQSVSGLSFFFADSPHHIYPLSDQSWSRMRSNSSSVMDSTVPCLNRYGKENAASLRTKLPAAKLSAINGTYPCAAPAAP